ncbi:hypothetical protein G7Z17_g13560 [Cylindrodendrum hubeiense]|uniref:Uncharacterized protein n=1 Tax=Cylindrodendrum hubeiense TaxID=595255 RepID=A0A9P5H0S9_9HYPO|nr:hypothetical protein G7Z17_g13560 [Cylindrodendrum hubeiense]
MSAHRQVPSHFKEEPVANLCIRIRIRISFAAMQSRRWKAQWPGSCMQCTSHTVRNHAGCCSSTTNARGTGYALLSGRSEAHARAKTNTGLRRRGTTKSKTPVIDGCEAGGPEHHHTRQANLVNGTPRPWTDEAGGVMRCRLRPKDDA